MIPIYKDGELIYDSPSVQEIQEYSKDELNTLWGEYKRLKNPHVYKVDLSHKLYNLKQDLLKAHSFKEDNLIDE